MDAYTNSPLYESEKLTIHSRQHLMKNDLARYEDRRDRSPGNMKPAVFIHTYHKQMDRAAPLDAVPGDIRKTA